MKYGNLIYNRKGRLTIGDDIQLLAIENLYKYMGIDYSDVLRIPYHQLHSYNGEPVVLPISFPLYGFQHDCLVTQFSENIIPVFLGLSLLSPVISKKDVNYLKRFEPIGCRDTYTVNILESKGVRAYWNGCMTLTFPFMRNNINKEYKKIYCVDIEENFKKFIPKELLEDCEFVSHTYYASELNQGTEEKAREVYKNYIDNAKMIITTRLHAALPCAAAGIPIIWVKDNLSFRFTGNNSIVKFYDSSKYIEIDWNPKVLRFENHKEEVLKLASDRIQTIFNLYSKYYENKNKISVLNKDDCFVEYIDNTKLYINNKWNKDSSFEYVLWGVTQTSLAIHDFLANNYPNVKLVAVIDKFRKINFLGMDTCDIAWLEENKNPFVFVCTGAAIKEAKELFTGINKANYYLCCLDGNAHRLESV